MHASRIAAAVSVLLGLHLSATAWAASVPDVSSSFCGSAANASTIAHALISDARDIAALQNLARTTVAIERSASTMSVRRTDNVDGALSVNAVAPGTNVCLSYAPGTVLLSNSSSVSGITISAIAAALALRATRPWPGKPAHPEQNGSTVYVESRGRYLYVKFYDDPGSAPVIDSCGGEEFYRVDPRTYEVLPYNGCLVGGNSLHLPHIDELPS